MSDSLIELLQFDKYKTELIFHMMQMAIDPASDDSQIEDALLALRDVCGANDIRPKLNELTEFVLKSDSSISNKDKIVATFVLESYASDLFDVTISSNNENVSKLKSAILRGSFPVNLMEDVVIVEDIDNREAQRVWGICFKSVYGRPVENIVGLPQVSSWRWGKKSTLNQAKLKDYVQA